MRLIQGQKPSRGTSPSRHNHLISLAMLDARVNPLCVSTSSDVRFWEWRDHTPLTLVKRITDVKVA
jgi:hypothetical protein